MNRIYLFALFLVAPLIGCAAQHASPQSPPPEEPGTRVYRIGGGVIAIHENANHAEVTPDQIDHWIQTAATAVSKYLGKFPVARVDISIAFVMHHGEIDGVTHDGKQIDIRLPQHLTPDDLNEDWVMTHEMFHLAFPVMPDQQKWINEGLSTYLEPIARARNGTMSQKECWGQYVVGLSQGKPGPEARGLNFDRSRDRVYWGGCLFWLEADIQIRQQTHDSKSLVDALRAILAAGGDGSVIWPPEKTFDIGDHATGTKVLTTLYAQYGNSSGSADLDELWKQLGVEYRDEAITFHDDAPLAGVRRAISEDVKKD